MEIKEKIIDNFTENGERTSYGIKASSLDLSKIANHTKPEQLRDEIPTLNRCGYMKQELDEYSSEFIKYASDCKQPVLEIGPAYGFVTHALLKQNIDVIASDLSKEHLEILVKDAPQDKLAHLYLYPGAFPSEIDFEAGSLDGLLVARVIHFLRGEEIEEGLEKIHKWLVPGGKFFCNNCSIYHYAVKEKMLSTYKEREARGDRWPGEIENHWEVAPEHKDYVRNFFHPFDIALFEKILPEYGFEIEHIGLFDHPSDNLSDNQGHIGFVARKL